MKKWARDAKRQNFPDWEIDRCYWHWPVLRKDITTEFSWRRLQMPETDTFQELITASQKMDNNATDNCNDF